MERHFRIAVNGGAVEYEESGERNGKAMLYDGWIDELARKLQRALDEIVVEYNFDLGDEYESALAQLLRQVLPERLGICRGFVVGRGGEHAGDDLIVYDRSSFPTLRMQRGCIERKERVPAEAAQAYIEAKFTLDILGDGGQSLRKACRQTSDVRAIPRTTSDGTSLHTAIFATAARVGKDIINTCAEVLAQELLGLVTENTSIPDVIVAGDSIALPGRRDGGGVAHVERNSSTAAGILVLDTPRNAFGIAVIHMLWACDGGRSSLPWQDMIVDAVGGESAVWRFVSR
jgi:hypothetical protein